MPPDGILVENHAWCAVKVQGEYRFVDCWLASPYYHANQNTMETHWFLSSPLDMIYTHFPSNAADQYLEPPVSINTFFALPSVCIPFFRHRINVINYDPSDDMMNHITLQVGSDIACYAEVETRTQHESNRTTLHRTRGLAQCLGDGNNRICKIKAALPVDQWMGWLKIYAGPRATPQHGQQEKLNSNHYPLALCFRLTRQTQQKDQRPFDFVQLHLCQYEFYIQEPQCHQLYPLQRYNFSVKSNHTHHKLAVRSPNGRLYKLTYYPHDHTYDGTLTVSEVGQWSLVCLLHHAGGLYIVASWECKA
ncbi:hypothetical protein BJV82DRAFT_646686 [Fennellomyces sp. T-0311]|nr:hypothetical protein BJV82DRAFT_646686 [Fennellomyces sp. T-0311]